MKTILAALVLLPAAAFGQASIPRVSLDARGDDIREVFATLFAQAHKSYALDASIKGKLYVTLDALPFPKALNVVLAQAGLVARDQDGVTMIVPAPKPVATKPVVVSPKPVAPTPVKPVEKKEEKPVFSSTVFAHRVTTRLSRAPLADVFAAFGDQAGVEIELAPDVPAYRVDAFFVKSSLRYALDRICKAAGLHYETTADGLRILRAKAE